MKDDRVLENVRFLGTVLEWRATDAPDYFNLIQGYERDYERIRNELLRESKLVGKLPKFINNCIYLEDFWNFIKDKFSTYKERRTFIHDELRPLFDLLETNPSDYPCDNLISTTLGGVNPSSIKDDWEKALSRRDTDPDGAITSARSLLESTCKYVLDDLDVSYNSSAKLPALYKSLSNELEIAPNRVANKKLKKVLGGCMVIVEGLGSMRNEFGDAHGKGIESYKPTNIYSQLAANLAGAMACFLLLRWTEHKPEFVSEDHEKSQSK